MVQDRLTDQKKYHVNMRALGEPITINKMHAWEIQLNSTSHGAVSGARIGIDGGMPQHGHGFPTKPRVTRELGNGRYLLEGMKFSMPGLWEIKLQIDGPSGADEVTFNLNIAARAAQSNSADGAVKR